MKPRSHCWLGGVCVCSTGGLVFGVAVGGFLFFFCEGV